jgi:hypothetical protein
MSGLVVNLSKMDLFSRTFKITFEQIKLLRWANFQAIFEQIMDTLTLGFGQKEIVEYYRGFPTLIGSLSYKSDWIWQHDSLVATKKFTVVNWLPMYICRYRSFDLNTPRQAKIFLTLTWSPLFKYRSGFFLQSSGKRKITKNSLAHMSNGKRDELMSWMGFLWSLPCNQATYSWKQLISIRFWQICKWFYALLSGLPDFS